MFTDLLFYLRCFAFCTNERYTIFFARKIWLLGVFALLHAFVEWVFLYMYLYPNYESLLSPVKFILLLLSYLFYLNSHVLSSEKVSRQHIEASFSSYTLYTAPVIYIISLSSLLGLIIIQPSLDGAIAAIRYTYGFFGSLFLGIGLYYYGESLKKSEYVERLKIYFKVPGVAFICYALFSGYCCFTYTIFSRKHHQYHMVLETFGIPVQFLGHSAPWLLLSVLSKLYRFLAMRAILRWSRSLKQIKRFSSDVSHELKTPLTTNERGNRSCS